MTLAVYVAGASAEVDRARGVIYALSRYFGVTITHDWTAQVIEARRSGRADHELSDEERLRIAELDERAVIRADLVWLLAPAVPSTGAWWELGYAHASHTRTIVSGPGRRACVFTTLVHRLFEHDTDALAWIAAEAAVVDRTLP